MKTLKCWFRFCDRLAMPNKITCSSCKEKLMDLALKVSEVLR